MLRDSLDSVKPPNGLNIFMALRTKVFKVLLIIAQTHSPNLFVDGFASTFILTDIHGQKALGNLGDDY
jgi:hypothetical protein